MIVLGIVVLPTSTSCNIYVKMRIHISSDSFKESLDFWFVFFLLNNKHTHAHTHTQHEVDRIKIKKIRHIEKKKNVLIFFGYVILF